MKILKNVSFIFLAFLTSFSLAEFTGGIYANMFNAHGSWVNAVAIAGFPTIYIFLVPLLFVAWGDTKKYWWIGFSLVPIVFAVFYLDWFHWYFWVAVALLGWLIGFGIQKLVTKLKTNKQNNV